MTELAPIALIILDAKGEHAALGRDFPWGVAIEET